MKQVLKRATSGYVLGLDRTKPQYERLKTFQGVWPDTYQSEAVHAFWSDLLMEVELGKDLDEILEIPYNVPNTNDGSTVTVRHYLTLFSLKFFLDNYKEI